MDIVTGLEAAMRMPRPKTRMGGKGENRMSSSRNQHRLRFSEARPQSWQLKSHGRKGAEFGVSGGGASWIRRRSADGLGLGSADDITSNLPAGKERLEDVSCFCVGMSLAGPSVRARRHLSKGIAYRGRTPVSHSSPFSTPGSSNLYSFRYLYIYLELL